jgi:hypothetical protein
MASAKTRRGRRSARSTNASRTPGPALRRLGGEHAWQEWQGSPFARVRSRSPAAREPLETGGLTERARTGANGREHLPCRRSWVRVPSSALESSCKSAGSVVRPVNGSEVRGKVRSRSRGRRRPKSPRLRRSLVLVPVRRGHASPANQPNRLPAALRSRRRRGGRAFTGLASRHRRLQKVICAKRRESSSATSAAAFRRRRSCAGCARDATLSLLPTGVHGGRNGTSFVGR